MSKDLIKALHQNKLELDCTTMILKRQSEDTSTVHSGPGFIRQDENGRLFFRLFSDQVSQDSAHPFPTSFPGPGVIVPDDAFYTLVATDSNCKTWESKRILPYVRVLPKNRPIIVTGDLGRITNTDFLPFSNANTIINLTFYDDFEFPTNRTTHTESRIDGVHEGGGSSVDAAKFSLDEHRVTIKRQDQSVQIHVECAGEQDPYHFENKFIESAEFAFAQIFNRASLETSHGNKKILVLNSRPVGKTRSKYKSPIRYESYIGAGPLYHLLNCYFCCVKDSSQQHRHAISVHTHSVVCSSGATIGAQALEIAVAVEGLLNDIFSECGSVQDDFREDVETARRCVSDLELDAVNKRRILGIFGGLLSSSATGKLEDLADQLKVRREHIKAWKTLRNHATHGNYLEDWDSQKFFDLVDTVRVLFYTLVFAAIKYEGPCVDYSWQGWPERKYPSEMCW